MMQASIDLSMANSLAAICRPGYLKPSEKAYTPGMRIFNHLSQNTKGILCLMGALVFLTFSDSIIKWLSPYYPLHQITLFRALAAMVIVFLVVQWEGGFSTLKTRRPMLHLFRGLLLVLANMFFFLGLSVMPLAEVVALFFTAPLFICILARPVLGEQVGMARWLAICVGLIGVIVMVRPDAESFTWSSVLPVLAAMTYASMQMITRKLGMRDTAGTMTFYMQIAFIIVSIFSGLIMGDGRFNNFDLPTLDFLFRSWRWPDSFDLMLMVACGLIVGCGGYLMSQSYRLAQASVVAPFEYTSLPFALVVGFVIWGDLPGQKDIIGTILIVGSGLLVVLFEIRTERKRSLQRGRA
jgi:drug/metabolite transporter (DMT)-like permease